MVFERFAIELKIDPSATVSSESGKSASDSSSVLVLLAPGSCATGRYAEAITALSSVPSEFRGYDLRSPRVDSASINSESLAAVQRGARRKSWSLGSRVEVCFHPLAQSSAQSKLFANFLSSKDCCAIRSHCISFPMRAAA